MENYKPFISEGVVLLVGDENSSQKVKILRDTGATQSLMLDSVLPLTENSFTGANVLISGVEMGILEVPLHEVNIKSSLINGNIVIVVPRYIPCLCGYTFNERKEKEAIKEQYKEEIGLSGTFLENTDGKFEERNKEKA